MANPKKRKTKCRTRTRRSHDAIARLTLTPCPKCKSLKMPHRMCTVCFTYAGRQVIEIKPKATKEEAAAAKSEPKTEKKPEAKPEKK